MALEIERKFLVRKTEWDKTIKPSGYLIQQGFLIAEPDLVIRVRTSGSKAWLTIKGKTTHYSRKEFEYEIPFAEALEMLHLFAGNLIEKNRYEVEVGGKTWEVDEFHGQNQGLILAEIELEDEDENFQLPDWAGEEVSNDPRYYNAWLSKNPFTTWQR